MKRAALLLSALLVPAFSIAQAPAGAGAPVVYFSLFGPDGSALQRFYRAVFDWQVTDNGDVATTVTPPLTGTIAQGAAEAILYVGVADISATLQKVLPTAVPFAIRDSRFRAVSCWAFFWILPATA